MSGSHPTGTRQTVRVYLAAPIEDMQAEREMLARFVMPELNERCGVLNVEVELVDPLAELPREESASAETVNEVLRQIDQSHPWFVALIGQHTGRPLGEAARQALAAEPRLPEEVADLLQLEVHYGPLRGDANAQSFFYMRDEAFLDSVPIAQRGELETVDFAQMQRLESLKDRIRNSQNNVDDGYPCSWDADTGQVADLEEFGKRVLEDLYGAIREMFQPNLPAGATATAGVALASASNEERSGQVDDEKVSEEILDVEEDVVEFADLAPLPDEDNNEEDFDLLPVDPADSQGPSSPADELAPHVDDGSGEPDENAELVDEVLDLENFDVAGYDQDESSDLSAVDPDVIDDLDVEDAAPPVAGAPPTQTHHKEETVSGQPGEAADEDGFLLEPIDVPASESGQPLSGFEPTVDLDQPPEEEILEAEDDDFLAEPIDELSGTSAPVEETIDALPPQQAPADSSADDILEDADLESESSEESPVDAVPAAPDEEEIAGFLDDLDGESPAKDEAMDFADMTETEQQPQADEPVTTEASIPADTDGDADDASDELPAFAAASEREENFVDAAAPAIQSSVAPSHSPARKKKSGMPMMLLAVLGIVLVGGGVFAGLFVGGFIPGFGGDSPAPVAGGPSDSTPGNNAGGGTETLPPDGGTPPTPTLTREELLQKRVAEVTAMLDEAEANPDAIDQAKLGKAETYLANVELNTPDLAADEAMLDLRSRLVALQDEVQRTEQFQEKMAVAQFDPATVKDEQLNQLVALALKDREKAEVADLRTKVEEFRALQQEKMAAEKKGQLTDALVAAGSADAFGQAVDNYATQFPGDARTAAMEKSADQQGAALQIVSTWNALLDDWAAKDMRSLSSEQAGELLASAQPLLSVAGQLPGAAAMAQRQKAVSAIASRLDEDGKSIVQPLSDQLAAPAAQAALILATQDGKRYFLAGRPSAEGDNLVVNHVADLKGTVAEAKIPKAQIDRAATGPAPTPAAAKALSEVLFKIEDGTWEANFAKAMFVLAGNKDLDPVVKTRWLGDLMRIGGQGSAPIAAAVQKPLAELAATGVDENFNWADPAASAAVRDKCAAALAKLPNLRETAGQIAVQYASLQSLDVPQRLLPVGMLLADAEGVLQIATRKGAPPTANLFVVAAAAPESPLEVIAIGQLDAGTPSFNEAIDQATLHDVQIVYALASPTSDIELPSDDSPDGADPPSDTGLPDSAEPPKADSPPATDPLEAAPPGENPAPPSDAPPPAEAAVPEDDSPFGPDTP